MERVGAEPEREGVGHWIEVPVSNVPVESDLPDTGGGKLAGRSRDDRAN